MVKMTKNNSNKNKEKAVYNLHCDNCDKIIDSLIFRSDMIFEVLDDQSVFCSEECSFQFAKRPVVVITVKVERK